MDATEAFGVLARGLPEPSLLVGRDGNVLAINAPALLLLGMPADAVINRPAGVLLNEGIEALEQALREALSGGGPRMLTLAIGSGRDGISLVFEMAAVDGETVLLRAIAPHDYTDKIAALEREVLERKKAEQQRDELLISERAARAELERAARMKDEFLATLSHELRTPLNAILGWAQYLKSVEAEPEELKEGMETIERNARLQTELVNDLLDMSRIISGNIHLDVKPTEFSAAVSAAVETVRPAAVAKGIEIVREALEPGGQFIVLGDSVRLQQIVWNLLSNAVKFTPAGGKVRVGLNRQGPHAAVLTVVDTGEGIRAEFLPHVFERFRQADSSTTRRHGGLGIGLAVVRHLVELHGGVATAASAGAGQGATMTVTLPLLSHGPERNAAAPIVTEPRLDGLRVLVVEDDADVRRLMHRLLSQYGALVTVAAEATAAFVQVQKSPPDVILSDIGMPGEDGYTLIQKIRRLPAELGGKTPAIAVTAYARDEDRAKTLSSGFQQHLTKPVDPAKLILMVSGLMAQRTELMR